MGLCVATLVVGDEEAAEDMLDDAVAVTVDGAVGEIEADPVIEIVLLALDV